MTSQVSFRGAFLRPSACTSVGRLQLSFVPARVLASKYVANLDANYFPLPSSSLQLACNFGRLTEDPPPAESPAHPEPSTSLANGPPKRNRYMVSKLQIDSCHQSQPKDHYLQRAAVRFLLPSMTKAGTVALVVMKGSTVCVPPNVL